jgi:TPR repeat protein
MVIGAFIGLIISTVLSLLGGKPIDPGLVSSCAFAGLGLGGFIGWRINAEIRKNNALVSTNPGIAETAERIARVAGEILDQGRSEGNLAHQAIDQIRLTAEGGNAHAQALLGLMYSRGDGVRRNNVESLKWCLRAAEQGHLEAQVAVAGMYGEGNGVEKNDGEAARWWRKAAEQGHTVAQTVVSMMYMAGRGLPKDGAEAFAWMRKAAEKGFAAAQYNLGNMYAHGQGVPLDYVQAYKWIILAAPAQKRQLTEQALNYLSPRMTLAEIDQAKRLANEWQST